MPEGKQVDLVFAGVKLQSWFQQRPRLEDQLALLLVKREPRYVDVTLTHGLFVPWFPWATAVFINKDDVRLRRYFVSLCHFCAVIDIKVTQLQPNVAANEQSYSTQRIANDIFYGKEFPRGLQISLRPRVILAFGLLELSCFDSVVGAVIRGLAKIHQM